MPLRIRYLSPGDLEQAAKNHHKKNPKFLKKVNYSRELLEAIKSNYIRHELTDYEKIISKINGKMGNGSSYPIIRELLEQRIKQEWSIIEKQHQETLL